MANAAVRLPEGLPVAPSTELSPPQEALVSARIIFQDFGLTESELQRAALGLAMIGGGSELERIVARAKKKPGTPWDSVDPGRREVLLTSALNYGCSAADRERMALRTGAGLILLGENELGRKILQLSPEASFGVVSRGFATWVRMGQLFVYAFMIALIAAQSALTGLYLFLIAGVSVVLVVVVVVWFLERNRWKLEREEREARHYLEALLRIDRGTPPQGVFAPDGSLLGARP